MKDSEELERAHLAQAERAIADSERRIVEQELRIDRLRLDGHDVASFEATLAAFRRTFVQMHEQRSIIFERMAALGIWEEGENTGSKTADAVSEGSDAA